MSGKRFLKQETNRYARVEHEPSWRKPRGKHSKMREHRKGNPPVVDAGFGGPKDARSLHPTGLAEVLVRVERDLQGLAPAKQGVRLSATLSKPKKFALTEAAKKAGLTVFNPGRKPKAKPAEKIKKAPIKEEKKE